MKSEKSWSASGGDDEIRAAAEAAARRAGMSLDDWLKQAVAERPTDLSARRPRHEPPVLESAVAPPADADDLQAVTDAVGRLTRRIRAMDDTSRASITDLSERLDHIERQLKRVPALRIETGERARSVRSVSALVEALERDVDNADERARSMVEGQKTRPVAARPGRDTGPLGAKAILDRDSVAPARPPVSEDRLGKLDELRDRLDALLAGGPQIPRETPQPRAAALDATLKTLETRIDEARARVAPSAAPAEAGAPPAPEGDQLRRIEQRLADITGRLDATDRPQPANPRPAPAATEKLATAIAEISARQRLLDERSEALALRREQKGVQDVVGPVRADINGLGKRIEALAAEAARDRAAYAALAARIDALAADAPQDRELLAAMRDEIEGLRASMSDEARTASLAEVEAGHRRIAERLEELGREVGDTGRLDGLSAEIAALRVSVATATDPAVMARYEGRVAELLRGVDAALSAQSATAASSFSGLSARLDDIRGAIDDLIADSRRFGNDAIARLETRLDEVVERVESIAERVPTAAAVAELSERVQSLAGRLDQVGREPAAAIAGFNDQLAVIAKRLDNLSAHQHEPIAAIAGLRVQIGALGDRLDRITSDQSEPANLMSAIRDQIEGLVGRIEAANASSTAESDLAGLHQRLAWLASRLDDMNSLQREPVAALDAIKGEIAEIRRDLSARAPQPTDRLEDQIRDLADRLEAATLAHDEDNPALAQLETQVAALASELERSVPTASALNQVEVTLARLQAHLSDNKRESIEAARSAAREAVSEIADQIGQAGQSDSELVRSLKADLESLRQAANDGDPAGRETLADLHDTLSAVVERLTRLEVETRHASEEIEREAAPLAEEAVAAIPRAAVVPAAVAEAPSGEARTSEAKPDIAALRELTATSPDNAPERRPADRRADFIAAARRAAQAAAAEAAIAEVPAGDKSAATPARQGSGPFARIGQAIRNRRRPLLLAAAAIVLAIGALQYFGHGVNASGIADDSALAAAVPARPAAVPATVPAVAAATPPSVPKPQLAALVAPATTPSAALAFAAPEAFASRFGTTEDNPTGTFSADPAPVAQAAPAAPAPVPAVAAPAVPAAVPAVVAASTAPAPIPVALSGAGTAPDAAKGSAKLVAALNSGDPAAAFEVAARYAEGRGVSANLAKAAEWYQKAADGGIAVAQYRLGSLYERGQGVAKDLGKAVMWYQRAADQGNIGAMHNLAVLMSEGVDGPPDHAKAFQWFLAAGSYGVKDSQYNLGVLFARGIGTTANLPESYKWFAAAAAQGDPDAATRRDEVAQMLSADDLAKARAAFQAWKAKTPLAEANGVTGPAGGWDNAAEAISEGDRTALVRKIQSLLVDQGYDPGPPDGVEGPKTRDAVRAFQKTIGVAATGRIDTNLVAALSNSAG